MLGRLLQKKQHILVNTWKYQGVLEFQSQNSSASP